MASLSEQDMSSGALPITVIVTTRNEAGQIERCLNALSDFDQVIVVDSESTDQTRDISVGAGAEFINFKWDGKYPKKRQWCLETLSCRHNWVFMVDADEVVTKELVAEMRNIWSSAAVQGADIDKAGFFVKGRYIIEGRRLNYGIMNNKLALFDKTKMGYPDVDDLSFPGMGEIEGHYQPCFVHQDVQEKIGQLGSALDHYAIPDWQSWEERHKRYAAWESHMTHLDRWPKDPVKWREFSKRTLRTCRFKPFVMFVHSYLMKLGFMDGAAGFRLARSRYRYYAMILKNLKTFSQDTNKSI